LTCVTCPEWLDFLDLDVSLVTLRSITCWKFWWCWK